MNSVGVVPAAVRLVGLAVDYGDRPALRGLTVDVRPGEWLALVGPNGAGKSTVLRAVAGLVGHRGEVALGGTPAASLGRAGRARRVAYVAQQPELPAGMTGAEYVLLGRSAHLSYLGRTGRRDLAVVTGVLDRLDLADLAGRPLAELSGGERQRLVIARALAQQPDVLLLDEPTSALDIGRQVQVMETVDTLRREDGLAVLAAMHDLSLAGQFADRLLLLSAGRQVLAGPPAEVLTPATLAAAYGVPVQVTVEPDGTRLVVARRHPPEPGRM